MEQLGIVKGKTHNVKLMPVKKIEDYAHLFSNKDF